MELVNIKFLWVFFSCPDLLIYTTRLVNSWSTDKVFICLSACFFKLMWKWRKANSFPGEILWNLVECLSACFPLHALSATSRGATMGDGHMWGIQGVLQSSEITMFWRNDQELCSKCLFKCFNLFLIEIGLCCISAVYKLGVLPFQEPLQRNTVSFTCCPGKR